ncbi:MAG: signal recognition particle-docking protein FtsY [Actinomycetota bacterium]
MPEGIVPELFIVLGLVLLVGVVAFAARRKPGRDTSVVDRPERTKTPTRPAERPKEDSRPVSPPAPVVEAPPEVTEEVEAPPEPAVKPSLRERLAKSRKFIGGRLADALGQTPDEDTWDDVEAALIQADIGVATATKIVEDLRETVRERKIKDPDEVMAVLNQELVALFDTTKSRALVLASNGDDRGPTVWLVVGVNGTGKTTTIGKLAGTLSHDGRKVALAAADTFRAAADEQLGAWGDRSGAHLVKHQPGADPGAVAFDAYRFAKARELDVLIVDTAGRLHTKVPLMDELSKVRRVIEKEGTVHESLLVIDATAGQNGLNQAREFAAAAGVTGVVLTKLDGTAKGGIALTIEDTLDIPIKLIGVGEGIDDLEPFDPKAYVDAILS